ncbi:hypothetical protein [Psychromonas hadalis]|uniref:hypothetical protein n=2 Tax=Psychromonas hadalis TaxID=211669 RepID=UPI0003B48509|nr:hypothetical protein [Psychromonas hadalis]
MVENYCCLITGRWKNAQKQMLNGARSGLQFGAVVYYIFEWGDMGHAQQSSMPIAGYLYGASLAWGVENNRDLDINYWLATLYCSGDKKRAELFLALQDIYLEAGIDCPNCAFFGSLLFDQKSARHIKHARDLIQLGFKQVFKKLAQYLAQLLLIRDSYLQKQLIWSAEILQHECLFGIELVKQNALEAQKLEVNSCTILSEHLFPLIAEYQRLWRIEHREGSLRDSVERLQYLQGLYDNIF